MFPATIKGLQNRDPTRLSRCTVLEFARKDTKSRVNRDDTINSNNCKYSNCNNRNNLKCPQPQLQPLQLHQWQEKKQLNKNCHTAQLNPRSQLNPVEPSGRVEVGSTGSCGSSSTSLGPILSQAKGRKRKRPPHSTSYVLVTHLK